MSPHYGTLGGVRLIIDALAAAALAAGHEVAAVVDGDAPPWAEPRWAVRFHPFPRRLRDVGRVRRFAFRFPPTAGRLIAAVRRFAPDVVSVHCARFFAPYPALLRTATRAPQVVSLQEGALPADVPQNEGLFRLLVERADAVAACSEDAAGYATRVGHARRVRVVPNGYDPAELAAGVYAHPRPYVLGVGRLDRQKGFDVLIEAMAVLGRPEVDVLIAGEGTDARALEELARARGVETRLRLLGATDRPTTIALHRGAAVVACPSRWEGLPLVCLEALAVGRPVVGTRVNGIPEVIRDGETGLLVPPDDPPALARAIGRLLDEPATAAALAARGRALVEARHVWSRVASQYLALCAEVAAA